MWHLTPAILYLACAQGRHHRHPNSPSAFIINNDRMKVAPYSYNPVLPPPAQAPYIYRPPRPCFVYPRVPLLPCYNYPAQKLPKYINFYNAPSYNKQVTQGSMYYNTNSNYLRQRRSQMRQNPLTAEFFPFELDHSSDLGMEVDSKTSLDEQSYYEQLELVEKFGSFLKRQTQLDGSSMALNDAAHQYNALLAVIIALARVIRDSCADFDQIYDQVYMPIVNAYYKFGLANTDMVADMIDDYISKGRAHMAKIKKIKEELCEKVNFCSLYVDNAIKAFPLLYVKELETLEALFYLAQNYHTHKEEFNQIAKRGTVLPYLQNSKERLKEYVMHVVNSIEHLSDKPVRCN